MNTKSSSRAAGGRCHLAYIPVVLASLALLIYHRSTLATPLLIVGRTPLSHHSPQSPFHRLTHYFHHQQYHQQLRHNDVPFDQNRLAHWLDFQSNTLLNFMHFHKTGGNAIKSAFHRFYHNATFVRTAAPVVVYDSCYRQQPYRNNRSSSVNSQLSSSSTTYPSKQTQQQTMTTSPVIVKWRCDWEKVNRLRTDNVILTFGHQYLPQLQPLFPDKHIRSFTVLRHPFDRKLSFFFHFLVRARLRSEADVSLHDIHAFLLNESGSTGSDSGPNYYAGHLLSYGPATSQFVTSSDGLRKAFQVKSDRYHRAAVLKQAKRQLDRIVFVGLQSQPRATQCMLHKTMYFFNRAVGVVPSSRTPSLSLDDPKRNLSIAKINSGSYRLNSSQVWNSLSSRQKREFLAREDIDLNIYQYAQELFHQHVRLFGCEKFLEHENVA